MFAHLLQPITIGTMEVKNRVMMAPMGAVVPLDEDGRVTPALIAYFAERARGGVGMITVGISSPSPEGISVKGEVLLWDDRCLSGLHELVTAIRPYGTKFGIQLGHAGVCAALVEHPKGPSAVPPLAHSRGTPVALERDEIAAIVHDFAQAAERCVRAGFDYVEFHGAHGYLISQFLSPYFNRREDEYGGSFENRTRFLIELLHETRRKVGRSFPIGIRINGQDFLRRGDEWTLSDACKLAPILEQQGASYISVSFGAYGSYPDVAPPMYVEPGAYADLAEAVKRQVTIPVAAVGRIDHPALADCIIRDGKADLVALGRALLADPAFLEKAASGRTADIRPCIGDLLGCAGLLQEQQLSSAWPGPLTCTVNPFVGREWLRDQTGAAKRIPLTALIAGAGPAGLECARQAALLGHKVTVCESRGWIGGQLRLAAKIPGRHRLGDLIPWYERQLNQLGVEVRLNVAVTEDLVKRLAPQVLVVATGSVPEVPLGYVANLDTANEMQLLTADDLLEEETPTGENVVVVGVGQIGLQVADYLAEQGKTVWVFGNAPHFCEQMAPADAFTLIERLKLQRVIRNRKVLRMEILPGEGIQMLTAEGTERLPNIDTIVFADRRHPTRSIAEFARNLGMAVQLVGDAKGANEAGQGTILAAIATGHEVASHL